ncbi:MAG TPA: cytochrome c oxidase subunit II [Gemmatales bacterium]|nr:cytochrome c oxidase subunit II [Gemmatales bacterium]
MNWAMFAADLAPKSFWLPVQGSEVAAETDVHFYFIYWLNVFFFVAISAVLVYFCVKYRRKTPDQKPLPAPSHNTVLELVWSILPTLVCIALFYVGFIVYQDLMEPPPETFKINVVGQKWSWNFKYPRSGLDGGNILHVPANTPIELTMTSTDVIHCVYIPAMRTKKDVVPGRYSKMWFNAHMPTGQTTPLEYNIFCAEYCGTSHSEMWGKLIVHPTMDDFKKWEAAEIKSIDLKPPVELGKWVWERKGCKGCHSIDGTKGTGPTFKGLWGMTTADHLVKNYSTGSTRPVVVDENYLKESINEPNAEIRDGFPSPSPMPSFKGQLSDKQINGVIEFLKTIGKDAPPVPTKP